MTNTNKNHDIKALVTNYYVTLDEYASAAIEDCYYALVDETGDDTLPYSEVEHHAREWLAEQRAQREESEAADHDARQWAFHNPQD